MKMKRNAASARFAAISFLTLAAIAAPPAAHADQGGISFWLPGIFGSLAAVPGVPGWSFATLYIHTSVAANAANKFALKGQSVTGLKGGGNLAAFGPTYTFETPVLGGQAALSLLGVAGRSDASISATLTGTRGNTLSGTATDSRAGFGDV